MSNMTVTTTTSDVGGGIAEPQFKRQFKRTWLKEFPSSSFFKIKKKREYKNNGIIYSPEDHHFFSVFIYFLLNNKKGERENWLHVTKKGLETSRKQQNNQKRRKRDNGFL